MHLQISLFMSFIYFRKDHAQFLQCEDWITRWCTKVHAIFFGQTAIIQPLLIAHANLYFSHNLHNTIYLKTTDRGALVSLWSRGKILSNFFWPVSRFLGRAVVVVDLYN